MDRIIEELPPPPPTRSPTDGSLRATGEGWQSDVDVTALCREAASMLGPDEMIHGAEFSLYSAMSALELMDAKMDKAPPVLESLESRIASGALPVNLDEAPRVTDASSMSASPAARSVRVSRKMAAVEPSARDTPEDTIGTEREETACLSRRALAIFEGMAVCEVAWCEGGSLPETLYACLYLHQQTFAAMLMSLGWTLPVSPSGSIPPSIDLEIKRGAKRLFDCGTRTTSVLLYGVMNNRCRRVTMKAGPLPWKLVDRALTLAVLAQSLGTLRCCSIIRDVIILADIYEEEDFYPTTFGFRLTPPVEDESLIDLLLLAEGAIRSRVEVRRTGDGEDGEGKAGAESRIAEECILHHLEARRELLHACLALRDALTSKEQKRRLQALAKLRAKKAEKAEQLKGEKDQRRQEDEEDARPEGKVLDLDETSIKSVAPGASTALGTDEADCSLAGVGSTGVELDTDGQVQAAAVGLAALTTADVAEEAEGGEGGGGLRGKSGSSPGSSGATAKDASGGQGRADFGSSDAGGAARGRELLPAERATNSVDSTATSAATLETVLEATGSDAALDEGVESTIESGTPQAPEQTSSCAPLEGAVSSRGEEAHEVMIEGSGGGTVQMAPATIEVLDSTVGTEALGEEGRRDGESERKERNDGGGGGGVEDFETPLEGITRCKGHLEAAVLAFDSLLKASSSEQGSRDGGGSQGKDGDATSILKRRTTRPPPPSPPPPPSKGTKVTKTKRPPKVKGTGDETSVSAGSDCPKGVGESEGNLVGGVGDSGKVVGGAPLKLGGEHAGFAFEREINRHLLGSSPQHHVHFRRMPGAGPRFLRSFARETAQACGVVRCQDLAGVRRYLLNFSQLPIEEDEPAPGRSAVSTVGLFARSVAAVCLFRQDMILGRYNAMWFVAEAMTDMGVPDAVVNSSAGMAFLERVGRPIYETLRMLCLNRSRQRTSLEAQMRDWRILQSYADTVDDAFREQYGLLKSTTRYMTEWTLSEVLALMHRYLQIGVELQLPSSHEWRGMYWYWDFLITTKMATDETLWAAKKQLEAVKTQMKNERVEAERARQAKAAGLAAAAATPVTVAKSPAEEAHTAPGGKKKSKRKKKRAKKKVDMETTGSGAAEAAETAEAEEAAETSPTARHGGVSAEEAWFDDTGETCGTPTLETEEDGTKTPREKSWELGREYEAMDLKLRQFLCRGTVRLLSALGHLGLFRPKPEVFQFTDPAIVYRERYRVFQAFDLPALQSYEDFDTALRFDKKDFQVEISTAGEFFRAAKSVAQLLVRRGELQSQSLGYVPVSVTFVPSSAWTSDDHQEKGRVRKPSKGSPDEASQRRSQKVSAGADGNGDEGGKGDAGGDGAQGDGVEGKAEGSDPTPLVADAVAAASWAVERSETLTLAKVAVSNMLTVMQVMKRLAPAAEKARESDKEEEVVLQGGRRNQKGGVEDAAAKTKGSKRRGKGAAKERKGDESHVESGKGAACAAGSSPVVTKLEGEAKVEFSMHSQFPVVSVSFHGS